jgi:hypothetical protein
MQSYVQYVVMFFVVGGGGEARCQMSAMPSNATVYIESAFLTQLSFARKSEK